jgi:putative lipoprotein
MRFLSAAFLSIVLFSSPALAAKIELAGQVTYRERIALPDDAALELQLVDQTLPSLPPRLDVRATIGAGQVPLSFNLNFDDALILPGHNYALIAAIHAGGGLLFRNFEPYALNPLAPAQPVLIVTNLVGRIDTGSPSSSEAPVAETPAILDVTWSATAIGDAAVLPHAVPTLSIGDDMRAGGSGGCNSWFAQAEITGDTLRLGSTTSTLKACTPAIGAQEQAFYNALAATASWQVDGDRLTLFGADGKAVLVFSR